MIHDPLLIDIESLIEPERQAVERLLVLMKESTEVGFLARFVYNNLAVGAIGIQEFSDFFGAYMDSGDDPQPEEPVETLDSGELGESEQLPEV